MTARRNAGPVVVALAIVVVIGLGAILVGAEVLGFLGTLTADTAAIVVAMLLGALIIGGAVRHAGTASGLRRLRQERKAEAYLRTLAFLAHGDIQGGQEETTDDWAAVRRDLALWAGTGVLKRLVAVDGGGENPDLDDPNVRSAIDMLIREMRQDLGQTNLTLKQGELADLAMGPDKGQSG